MTEPFDMTNKEKARQPVTRILAILLLTAGVMLTGCSGMREAMCQDNEYPVWATDAPATGRECVPKGEQPPPGYARYPAGHVPHYLDEDYTPSLAPTSSPSPTPSG
jgi:hypothetical protein